MVFVAKLKQVIFEPNQRVAIRTNTVTQVWCMGVIPPCLPGYDIVGQYYPNWDAKSGSAHIIK